MPVIEITTIASAFLLMSSGCFVAAACYVADALRG